jgi:hypothetical protein
MKPSRYSLLGGESGRCMTMNSDLYDQPFRQKEPTEDVPYAAFREEERSILSSPSPPPAQAVLRNAGPLLPAPTTPQLRPVPAPLQDRLQTDADPELRVRPPASCHAIAIARSPLLPVDAAGLRPGGMGPAGCSEGGRGAEHVNVVLASAAFCDFCECKQLIPGDAEQYYCGRCR